LERKKTQEQTYLSSQKDGIVTNHINDMSANLINNNQPVNTHNNHINAINALNKNYFFK
jgi:hypothetical protein